MPIFSSKIRIFYLLLFLVIAGQCLPGSVLAFEVGPLSIGGAVRVNYTFGDYTSDNSGPSRASQDHGTIQLDTFRINLGYKDGPWVGKAEYRFYPGYAANNSDTYHFLHTGWFGYNFDDGSQVQVGVNRVPFGPGAYGVSQSFFFDMHYYVGLSDDMDLGVKYVKPIGNWTFDAAYYFSDEGQWFGDTRDSSRYSYDVVDESGEGYEERNQFNFRGIYALPMAKVGASLQYGQLKSNGPQDDGSHYAASIHAVPKFGNLTLATQLSYFKYDVDKEQPNGTDTLVQFGAWDFPSLVAAEAWLPAVSLNYMIKTDCVDWLDYMLPYAEYSRLMKTEDGFNDSTLITTGIAWANGGWYIYTETAFANGNDFIGNESGYGAYPGSVWTSNRHGENPADEWEYRVNLHFGYYF